MARTWSVPQRGSIAALGGWGLQHTGAPEHAAASRNFTSRGVLLVLAAVLTAAGAIIPQLSPDLLSNVLFVAGAGLAALVVTMPWQPLLRDAAEPMQNRGESEPRSAFSAETGRQMRFPELLGTPAAQPTLDRAAWAKLTAHMSHELRTPLNAVLGFSELMTNEVFGPLGSNYSGYARDIHTSGRILLKSAEDALAITALLTAPERKRARETSEIRAIVDDACAFVAPDLAASSIALAIDVKGDAEIVGDHQATRQMLINLVAEASRRAAPGAVLRIETKAVSEAVHLSLSLIGGVNVQPEDGFGIILARTFCELSGAELTSSVTESGEWTASVRLQRAAQPDLFAAAA